MRAGGDLRLRIYIENAWTAPEDYESVTCTTKAGLEELIRRAVKKYQSKYDKRVPDDKFMEVLALFDGREIRVSKSIYAGLFDSINRGEPAGEAVEAKIWKDIGIRLARREGYVKRELEKTKEALRILEDGGDVRLKVYIQNVCYDLAELEATSFTTKRDLSSAIRGALKNFRREFQKEPIQEYVAVHVVLGREWMPVDGEIFGKMYEKLKMQTKIYKTE